MDSVSDVIHVWIGLDVCRRQLSQWQCMTLVGAPRYSKRMSPHSQRPVVTMVVSEPMSSLPGGARVCNLSASRSPFQHSLYKEPTRSKALFSTPSALANGAASRQRVRVLLGVAHLANPPEPRAVERKLAAILAADVV